jgi:hypothetical protein
VVRGFVVGWDWNFARSGGDGKGEQAQLGLALAGTDGIITVAPGSNDFPIPTGSRSVFPLKGPQTAPPSMARFMHS